MLKRAAAVVALTLAVVGATTGMAGAAPEPSDKDFRAVCLTGTLAGETLTVVTNKWVYMDDGTLLRVTALRFTLDGEVVKDKEWGKTQGTLTCGGEEATPDGTFGFFARFVEA